MDHVLAPLSNLLIIPLLGKTCWMIPHPTSILSVLLPPNLRLRAVLVAQLQWLLCLCVPILPELPEGRGCVHTALLSVLPWFGLLGIKLSGDSELGGSAASLPGLLLPQVKPHPFRWGKH